MTFEDIEPHFVGYTFFSYAPQDSMGVHIDTVLVPGSNFNIYSGTGGENTEYFWYRNGEPIPQSTDADTLLIENVSYADTGIYLCFAENSLATELTLKRRPVHISIDTGTSVKLNQYRKKELKLYPNPASGIVNFMTDKISGKHILNIYNTNRTRVYRKEILIQPGTNSTMIDLNNLKQGIYIVELKNNTESFVEKLIINKQGTNR